MREDSKYPHSSWRQAVLNHRTYLGYVDWVEHSHAADFGPPADGFWIEEKRALCAEKVTLDDKPAVISGAKNLYATVTDFQSGLSAEFSWDTVKRVVAKGGKFKS